MNELHAILDCWRSLEGRNREAVLATVVHVTGSAYRRPGARMLIVPDGRRIGSVSGGCLEGEITKRAWWFTESGHPSLRVYDTSSDDDAVWEFGLGCNGVVHVLLERVNTANAAALLEFLDGSRKSSEAVCVATVIQTNPGGATRPGDRLFMGECTPASGILAGTRLGAQLPEHGAAVLREKKSRLVHLDEADVFVEWIAPPPSLVVFGAGHDVIPVVTIASQLGWRVTVADGRRDYARRERFPAADRVVIMPSGDLLHDIEIDHETCVVMMTHSFPLDTLLLPDVLAKRPRYLGILGPRTRTERLFRDAGFRIPENVHAPIGLDIGCDTPATVALSIVAEIQATTAGRSGVMLKFRTKPIHDTTDEVGVPGITRDTTRLEYCETSVGNV